MIKEQIKDIFHKIEEINIKDNKILLLKDEIEQLYNYEEYTQLSFRKKIEFILKDEIDLFIDTNFIDIFKKHLIRVDGKINSPKLRNKSIKFFIGRIDSKYPHLEKYNLEHKWYYIKEGLTDIPKCDGCNTPLEFFVWGRRFCSQNCAVTSIEARERARENNTNRVLSDIQKLGISNRTKKMWESDEFRKNLIPKLKKVNQGNGKHFLKENGKPWNYGIPTPIETIEKGLQTRKDRGIDFKGKNNPQYGKSPSPKAGRGINGKYKGVWFRSSLELFYLIYFDKNSISFRTAETKEFQVEYILEDISHTYKPDFFIESTGMLYEIKPLKRTKDKTNILKMTKLKEKFGEDKCKFMTEVDIKSFIDKVKIKDILDIIKNKDLVMTDNQEKRLLSNFKRIQYDTRRSV